MPTTTRKGMARRGGSPGYAPVAADRRTKAARLTAAQRRLVEGEVAAGWVEPWARACVPPALLRHHSMEEAVAEAWLLVVRAASIWRPGLGATFRSFAMSGVKKYLPVTLGRKVANRGVWAEMPQFEEGDLAGAAADRRRPPGPPDPLLRDWCSDEYRALRRGLGWRARLVIYLRYVECWTLQEVGDVLGVHRERVRQIEATGAADMGRG